MRQLGLKIVNCYLFRMTIIECVGKLTNVCCCSRLIKMTIWLFLQGFVHFTSRSIFKYEIYLFKKQLVLNMYPGNFWVV